MALPFMGTSLSFLLAAAMSLGAPGPSGPTTPVLPGPSPAPVMRQEWSATPIEGAPSPRWGHTAVWTGTRMLVWGGSSPRPVQTGGAYDPVTASWTPISTEGAPSPRVMHTAVWTGSRMLVWGGWNGTSFLNDGAAYDPLSDRWTPLDAHGAPSPRSDHAAVWTGTRMIVWGGYTATAYLDDGGVWDAATGAWTSMTRNGAPPPRQWPAAVWTGTRLFVWGGKIGQGMDDYYGTNTGGLYDPERDAWSPVSMAGAPTSAPDPVAVFTGSVVIVWTGALSDRPWVSGPYPGGIYDPARNSWRVIDTAPRINTSYCVSTLGNFGGTAVWTGSRMLVWGGFCSALGGLFDPERGTWTDTTLTGAPARREQHSAVWTGSQMIVWGGIDVLAPPWELDSGGALRIGR